MRRWSDRGGTEPLAALVAVAVVCAAVSLYAGALPVPERADERVAAAERLLDRVEDWASRTGVLHPGHLDHTVPDTRWEGRWRVNVTVRSGKMTWQSGPTPPEAAASVSRRVSVRHPLGRVRPGRVRVVVW
jgi:hypothetical protein